MHHLYPLAKGDPLCPLGFHPQVRWPTRCKRCFRDYKEHGGKKRDDSLLKRKDTTSSTPSLSWSSRDSDSERRSWVSSSNLATEDEKSTSSVSGFNNPSSWTSTPDLAILEDDTQAVTTTVSIKLPKRKQKAIDTVQRTISVSPFLPKSEKITFNKYDNLATRARKLQAIKETDEKSKRIQIKEVKSIYEEPTNNDVQFIIQVKKKINDEYHDASDTEDDNLSLAGTETTDTTLVDANDHELREQVESLRKELETTKAKCDRLERDKSDFLLRRLAAMETTTSKTTATEMLKLQQKFNEIQQQLEDYKDEKRSLSLRVKELEVDLDQRPTTQQAQKVADELRSKLLAAETLCEELMDENEDIKKELRDMEEQMDEMQDNFREDQAVEYTSLKKELDQTTKNCRILSFKLRKAERRVEQLEQEKGEVEVKLKEVTGSQATLVNLEKIKQLEQELKIANEVSLRLQKELDELNHKLNNVEDSKSTNKKKAPMLASIGKFSSGDNKVSRETLTRGGSQDDPAQLLRDLQDSLEREADLREQLKFAEEEAQNLRKKVSRIEDDNESLVLQLKKMATRARSCKLSPTNSRLTPEPPVEKSDQSDDEDPAEIKLQLELSEQEASVLRRKVEDLEADNHRIKTKNKELQDKLITKITTKKIIVSNDSGNSIQNQKLKVLEDETNDLRKKLIEKERDCERLHAELSLNQKRSKTVQKSKSLDLDQQTLDLKRQLHVIEQEAAILRTKVQSLEIENEKLSSENKKLQLLRGTKNLKTDKSIDKYIDQIAKLEIELNDANKKIKQLEDKQNSKAHLLKETTQYRKFIDRTPKKISSLTSKDQLKTMVNDLENEIGEMLVAIKTSENEKIKLEEEMRKLKQRNEIDRALKELEEMNKRYEKVQTELKEEKTKSKDLNKSLTETKDNLTKAVEEKKKLSENIEKYKDDQHKLQQEKKKLDEEITKLERKLESATSKRNELSFLNEKAETLKINLDSREKELANLKIELADKNKIMNDLNEKTNKLSVLERKINETEEKYKKNEKQRKEKIKDLENKIAEEKDKNKSNLNKWDNDKKKFNSQIDELNNTILTLETTVESKKKLIEYLEENLKKERDLVSKTNLKVGELENSEINKLKEVLNKSNLTLCDLEEKLENSEKSQKKLQEKLNKSESENKTNKVAYEKKTVELELELQSEKKKLEVMKHNQEKENKNKELELATLKSKIKNLELGSGQGSSNKKVAEIKQFQDKIEKLESNFSRERQKYEHLTSKYEILEEEHVVTKAQLVMEKESLESQLVNVRHEMHEIETELKTLRETYHSKHDIWIKEKLDMQEKIKELERKSNSGLEKARLKEKQSELEQIKKEYEVINDHVEYLRKENDELKKKLDDYQKVNKIQRNISADSSAMEKEIRQLKIKLNAMEKSKKSDVTECKMRYDNQLSIVNGELQALQSQVLRFKRERDNYKHMLESAQKTIGDLKNCPKNSKDISVPAVQYDELEESKTKIITLEQQISCMEDELSEVRLESSRLKTELVSERSTWEVKMSELHSRINELEEEKILSSGRTKIVGLRTKMELAWQKEREEQQRLLQETATLARDLRQTLFEVERERDKERLEVKRKQEQLKKSSEEDHDENKKKITELQCDLLELRDAHAKLRTTNEKLRREKERYEKEREEFKMIINGKKKSNHEDERKINALIEQIDVLKQLAPELFFSRDKEAPYTPTPPRRTRGSKSRETSPALEKKETSEDKQQQIQTLMQRLVNTTEDLRKYKKSSEDEYERERIKRAMGIRRATSTENDNSSSIYNMAFMRKRAVEGSLHRKSLSLEHTIQNEQKIWKNDNDSMSSLQSLDATSDVEWVKNVSLDSRLSGGSTQSDVVGEKKKKKGIIGKLRKLTKSRSIDDQDPETFLQNKLLFSKPNSNSDINVEKGSKKDLKDRITGIFKKGSSSRSNSLERQKTEVRYDTSSTQRPLMRNGGSIGNVSRNSPDQEKTFKGKSKKN